MQIQTTANKSNLAINTWVKVFSYMALYSQRYVFEAFETRLLSGEAVSLTLLATKNPIS
jgi:hypothetical protein